LPRAEPSGVVQNGLALEKEVSHLYTVEIGDQHIIMAICPIPSLEEAQYPALQRVCRGLPATYAEWWHNQERNHRDERRAGHKIIAIMIEPAELLRFCRETGCQADTSVLGRLAIEKWREQDRG
jgi:hypothetical protein